MPTIVNRGKIEVSVPRSPHLTRLLSYRNEGAIACYIEELKSGVTAQMSGNWRIASRLCFGRWPRAPEEAADKPLHKSRAKGTDAVGRFTNPVSTVVKIY